MCPVDEQAYELSVDHIDPVARRFEKDSGGIHLVLL
jgi:hypothetical protein